MEDVSDSASAKRFVEIAGRERLAEQERRGIARSFVAFAEQRKATMDPNIVDDLIVCCDEANLMLLVRRAADLPWGVNLREFVRARGISLPELDL